MQAIDGTVRSETTLFVGQVVGKTGFSNPIRFDFLLSDARTGVAPSLPSKP
jgi:hypothetical protein